MTDHSPNLKRSAGNAVSGEGVSPDVKRHNPDEDLMDRLLDSAPKEGETRQKTCASSSAIVPWVECVYIKWKRATGFIILFQCAAVRSESQSVV